MNIDFSEALKIKRFPFLDAARGVACMGVVACHCGFAHLFHWYWGVMDFFFVMSGFLITRSLIANCDKGRGMMSFFLYRALRLLPAYLIVMLLYELLFLVLGTRPPGETLPYVFFYQNTDLIFGSVEVFPRVYEMIPYWSLVIEEHFYVLWGILFCMFVYAKLKITPAVVGVVVLMLGAAILMRLGGVYWWTLPGRFDGFLLGSIAGVMIFMPAKRQIPEKWTGWLFGIGWTAALLSLIRLLWTGRISYQDLALYHEGTWLDVTCFSIVSVVLVLGMVKIDIRRLHFGRVQNWCAFIGLISYEIYLVHFPIVALLKNLSDFRFNHGGILLFTSTLVLSSIVAHIMHKTLTAPALKRREAFHAALQTFVSGMPGFGRSTGTGLPEIATQTNGLGGILATEESPDPRPSARND